MHEVDYPKAFFKMVNGDGACVSTQLSSHRDVGMVNFTGSSLARIAISKAAADTLKRLSAKLCGKGANIIFEDADDKAFKRGARHCFGNSGRSCNAPTRMLVHKSRYDAAVEEVADLVKNTHAGTASEEGRHIGIVVSEVQLDKIQKLIEIGMTEARLVAGGLRRPDGLNRRYYVKPTVFTDVANEMTIACEEIFGPVLSIIPFESGEEAISIANNTPYGLTN